MLRTSLRLWKVAFSCGVPRAQILFFFLAAAVLPLGVQRLSWAQGEAKKEPKAVAKQPQQPAPRPPRGGKDKEPDLRPVDVGGNDLMTLDGVQLRATFYPGPKGKESVPVILLHSYKGDRKEFSTLAPFLQQAGHAVLVPDLRGHGESTNTLDGGKLDATKMADEQFEQMYYRDMQTLRKFLAKKNDAGELNLSKLCVVGCELGSLVALNWARYDWTPVPGKPALMDVKALVLISPPTKMRGLDSRQALNSLEVRSLLSILILVGREKGGREAEEAKRLHAMLKRYHPDPKEEERAEKQDLFFIPLPTKLQGSKMLGVRSLNVERFIGQFIDVRLVKPSRPEYNWRQRDDKGR